MNYLARSDFHDFSPYGLIVVLASGLLFSIVQRTLPRQAILGHNLRNLTFDMLAFQNVLEICDANWHDGRRDDQATFM